MSQLARFVSKSRAFVTRLSPYPPTLHPLTIFFDLKPKESD
jgi:hypothetical protein